MHQLTGIAVLSLLTLSVVCTVPQVSIGPLELLERTLFGAARLIWCAAGVIRDTRKAFAVSCIERWAQRETIPALHEGGLHE